MPRLLVDYNRCLWYALMGVLELDIKGLANDLSVQRQTIHRWIEGRGRVLATIATLSRYFPYWESSDSKGSPNEMLAS